MYYVIFKSGMYLIEESPYSSVWLWDETKAQRFWDAGHAKSVASKHECERLSRKALN